MKVEKETIANDVCLGLSGINLGDRVFEFGHGIQLRTTFAHVFQTDILAFERPATPTSFHPGPWQAVSHKTGTDILAELFIPKEYKHQKLPSVVIGHTIVSLLRLWTDPQISLQVVSHDHFSNLKDQVGPPYGEPVAVLHAFRERHIDIGLEKGDHIIESIDWVVEHWASAANLRASSPQFALAMDTFDNAQYIPSKAMMLVSIWGALEAIFAPHKAELVFRVSAQLAAFLRPRGIARLEKQKEIVKLYELRSAAVHGVPKHSQEDFVKTYALLRMTIIRMIELEIVPNKAKLEELLFVS